MTLEMLKSKIHRATVTQSALDYIGSITVDETLMEAAGLTEYEKVEIDDVDNTGSSRTLNRFLSRATASRTAEDDKAYKTYLLYE